MTLYLADMAVNKDAYWFSHDSNAKDDPKTMKLIDQLGLEGYGIYWVLIEVLRDQPTFSYPVDLLSILARRYNTSGEKMKAVVMGYGLFDVDQDNNFFSHSLNDRMKVFERMRDQRRIAGTKSAQVRAGKLNEISTTVQRPLNDRSTTVQLLKDTKLKDTKLKDTKVKDTKKEAFSLSFVSEAFYPVWEKWLEYRKQLGKPYKTIVGMQKKYSELIQLSGDNPVIADKIVDQSIRNEWQGFFALKNQTDPGGEYVDPVEKIKQDIRDSIARREKSHHHGS